MHQDQFIYMTQSEKMNAAPVDVSITLISVCLMVLNTALVAENLVLRKKFPVDTSTDLMVDLFPLYEYQLKKFQTYSGVPNRTVLLEGIQEVMDEEDLQDHLEIHFQKPSNYGGEVQAIKYIPAGKSWTAFFSDDNDQAEG